LAASDQNIQHRRSPGNARVSLRLGLSIGLSRCITRMVYAAFGPG
jgi:hypothetical protein